MVQKIIPLEESLATTRNDLGVAESRLTKAMQSIGAGLEAQVASTHEDAVQLASAVQQRMEDEVSALHGRVLSLDGAMVSLGQQAEQAEAASVAEATMLRAMFAQQKAESEETIAEKIIPLEDSLTQLQQQTSDDLAQLKADSEETMVQKIIPLEESLATTRKDLEHTLSHTITEIESTIDETRTDLTGQVDTLRSDLKGACFATTSMSRPLILRCCFWLCSPTCVASSLSPVLHFGALQQLLVH